jgi:serine/threonine protein kinase
MGAGASLPEQLDATTVQKLAGTKWDSNTFSKLATNGQITRAQFEDCCKVAFPTIQQLRQQSDFAKVHGTIKQNIHEVRKEQVSQKNAASHSQLEDLPTLSSAGIRGAFQRIKTLGKGSYGKVFLVRRVSNHQLYAMKVIRLDGGTGGMQINTRNDINLQQQMAEHALKEVQFLQMMQHPNVSTNDTCLHVCIGACVKHCL